MEDLMNNDRILARVTAADLTEVVGGQPDNGGTVTLTVYSDDPNSVDITNVDGDSD